MSEELVVFILGIWFSGRVFFFLSENIIREQLDIFFKFDTNVPKLKLIIYTLSGKVQKVFVYHL